MPGKRGRKRSVSGDQKVIDKAAGVLGQMPTPTPGPPVGGKTVGGLMRPWMTFGEPLRARTLVEDVGVVLWEGGEKTTTEIKRDIVDLLDQTDSLVAILDTKSAERPNDPRWWPSLTVVLTWAEEDPFFSKAIERWSHARQARILERVIWDLNGPAAADITKEEFALLKERVKFASAVLPRIVNRGLREKVDIETTNNHLHLHQGLSDEAIEAKLQELRRNPRVKEMLTLPELPGSQGPLLTGNEVVEGVMMPPMTPGPGAPLPFHNNLGEHLEGEA